MTQEELKALINTATLKGEPLETAYEETHISWVVFSKSYALKIKKPLRLSFLDFSSLELRKKYCELEFKLNKRFTSIYLAVRSEEHTSELQSRENLVCRLLLEKKKKKK